MNRLEKARQILTSAESGVRALVSDAANAGDYDDTLTLTNVAMAISSLSKSAETVNKRDTRPAVPQPNVKPVAFQDNQRTNGKTTTRKSRKTKQKDYPRFIQSDGDLVKIGWSKSASNEYQHKAPREVLSVIADVLNVQRMDDGVLRPPQEFLPLSNADGEKIPDYQSYLCIAWLRDIGVVERHGRHGYCVPDPTSIEERIEQAWNQLSHI